MTTLPISKRTKRIPAALAAALLVSILPLLVAGPLPLSAQEPEAAGDDAPPPPELLIQARTPDGEAIELDRAELLLVAFGEEKSVELPVEGSSARLPLTREWLCETWPERCEELARAMIFLGAEGRVLVSTDPFRWPGVGRKAPETVEIAFPDDVSTEVGAPGTRVVQVALRTPGSRRLRVVDRVGEPLEGVGVESHVYHNHLNACGELVGEPLGSATTDEEGLVEVPDGDFHYAFVFDQPHHILAEPQSSYHPARWITRLELTETLVSLRELELRPLDMRVKEKGEPVASVVLHGCRADCQPGPACGGPCCSPLAGPADEDGRIVLEDFRPLEYERVYLVDPQGNVLWEDYPIQWKGEGPIDVELAGRWVPEE